MSSTGILRPSAAPSGHSAAPPRHRAALPGYSTALPGYSTASSERGAIPSTYGAHTAPAPPQPGATSGYGAMYTRPSAMPPGNGVTPPRHGYVNPNSGITLPISDYLLYESHDSYINTNIEDIADYIIAQVEIILDNFNNQNRISTKDGLLNWINNLVGGRKKKQKGGFDLVGDLAKTFVKMILHDLPDWISDSAEERATQVHGAATGAIQRTTIAHHLGFGNPFREGNRKLMSLTSRHSELRATIDMLKRKDQWNVWRNAATGKDITAQYELLALLKLTYTRIIKINDNYSQIEWYRGFQQHVLTKTSNLIEIQLNPYIYVFGDAMYDILKHAKHRGKLAALKAKVRSAGDKVASMFTRDRSSTNPPIQFSALMEAFIDVQEDIPEGSSGGARSKSKSCHTVKELRALAKAKGLKGYSKLRKDELLALLKPTKAKTPKTKSKQ